MGLFPAYPWGRVGLALRSYERGFEDALELCLVKLRESNSLEEAEDKIRRLLGLVKERKVDVLERMIREYI